MLIRVMKFVTLKSHYLKDVDFTMFASVRYIESKKKNLMFLINV